MLEYTFAVFNYSLYHWYSKSIFTVMLLFIKYVDYHGLPYKELVPIYRKLSLPGTDKLWYLEMLKKYTLEDLFSNITI